MPQNPGLTRRGLVMLAAGAIPSGFRLYAANSDFWNKKEPAEWSSDEIDKLVTKSPWARQVTAASAQVSRPYATGGNGGGMGDPGIGGGSPGGVGYPGAGGMGGRGMGGGGR